MRTVNDMLTSFQQMEPDSIMEQSMAAGSDVYVKKQRDQMYDGINSVSPVSVLRFAPL